MWFWHILKYWLYLNGATAAFCYLLQIKRNQGLFSDCTSPFHVASYIISCLFHEIKLWPLNWLILESKSYTGTFSSESVRFLFELTVVQSFVNTAVKFKKKINMSLILPISSDCLQITWRRQVCVIWPWARYTGGKKDKKWKKME